MLSWKRCLVVLPVSQEYMQVSPLKLPPPEAQLQLMLFVDERPSSRQQVQQVHYFLKQLQADEPFNLQIIDVGQQPYLAEHFKVVATPALIKIHPLPQQVLAGSNLVSKLRSWWPRWQATEAQAELPELPDKSDAEGGSRLRSMVEEQSDHRVFAVAPVGSVADSTELLRLADEVFRLKQEKEELLKQLEFKDRVISMLAHDLRSPLTAVLMAVETLEANYNPPPDEVSRMTPKLAAQLFKQARAQTRASDRMISGLLQVARDTSAQLRLQPQKLELEPMCQDVIERLGDRCLSKSQCIKQDIPNDLPCVYGDPERIHQVVMNLVDNAIKYTPVGGSIHISSFHRTTQKVQVSVCDTGPGIPEDQRERIFNESFRLERDRAKDGYGIGLSLCQRIIQAHYGQIWVDSSDRGSCFHFTLPVYPN